jgi:hypothetical protein
VGCTERTWVALRPPLRQVVSTKLLRQTVPSTKAILLRLPLAHCTKLGISGPVRGVRVSGSRGGCVLRTSHFALRLRHPHPPPLRPPGTAIRRLEGGAGRGARPVFVFVFLAREGEAQGQAVRQKKQEEPRAGHAGQRMPPPGALAVICNATCCCNHRCHRPH